MSSPEMRAIPEPPESGMSRLVPVQDERGQDLTPGGDAVERGRWLCAQLEAGNILYFPHTPFVFPQPEREFLLSQKQTRSAYHKNVAYRPAEDRVTGLDRSEGVEAGRLAAILRLYSQSAAEFLGGLLPPYAGKWKLDYASFRPIEERGRTARLRARNDLPHVDAFPTRPTNGDRILRFFTNLNPAGNRVWLTSSTFEVIAPRFVQTIGLRPRPANAAARVLRSILPALHWPGSPRSPYDEFMHRCHNAMKEDARFREESPRRRWEFPPDSTWIVFTDFVSHAVLEGQYALEQTFIVRRDAMVTPEHSPLAILERLAGYPLTNPA
jgi:hypothetical protein